MPARPSVTPFTRGLVLALSLVVALGGMAGASPAGAWTGAHDSPGADARPDGARAVERDTDEPGFDALPADGWSGARTGGPTGVIPGDDAVLAAGLLDAGPAQFTYGAADPEPNGGASSPFGEWSFSTVADTSATIQIPWRYTGFHGFAGVTVGLEAFVVGSGSVTGSPTLVSAGPQSCAPTPCPEPSGGFDYAGLVEFSVTEGDTFGFTLSGSNGDTNATLRGELVLGTALPTDCADAQALYTASDDGRYVILPTGGQRFSVHCDDMNATAKDYLELHPEVTKPGFNFSSYSAGGSAVGTTVTTSFTRLRFDPATLLVDIDDRTFSTSTGNLTHPDAGGDRPVSSMPYATAMSCGGPDGTANVNLFGTPFVVDDTWVPQGAGPTGSAALSAANTAVSITANGNCGWNHPDTPAFLFVFDPNADRFVLQLAYANPTPPTLATPTLFASVSRSASTADLYALIAGAANTPVSVTVHKGPSCTSGALGSPAFVAARSLTTDASGYVALTNVPGISSGDFVTVTVTSPSTTTPSTCVRTTADNDAWPKALPLTFSSPAVVQDVIEVDGRARWYRFPIFPNQRLTISLTDVPADYELAVFRDIAAEFDSQLVPETSDDLNRLSAEFAPSVFSPSVFSPSVFSPSVFSPDAYAPSVFSPSVFSPSVFSPSVFSPSVFSPSVFSPSVFSPSVFSPSVFSEIEIQQAFSSAQSRSLIGVSATPGTGDETVVVNSWNEIGSFYVRVAGRGGAFDPSNLFTLTVTPSDSSCTGVTDTTLPSRSAAADAGEYATVILTDSTRLDLGSGAEGTLADRIEDLRTRPEVDGIVIDLADEPRVQQLRAQADASGNRGCPYAQNLVAEAIKDIVDSYRATSADADATETLRYVTIIGDDTVVPFFRYPDQSLLGQESGYFPPVESDSISEASLRRDYVLSQDAYGAGVAVDIRTTAFPVPDLAVGRLVETPAEIVGMIDAYLEADGVVSPDSSLVTGYDFLTDAADAVTEQLDLGGTDVDELVTDADVSPQQLQQPGMTDPRRWSWDADDLREALFGERHDMVFLAGHFSANSALAADYQTQVVTTELVASNVDLENSIVISAGCHAGYNLVDDDALSGVALPLDWAQAFAQKRAVLIAGTGYQYGDTDFLEYSERLYRDLAEELRAGAPGTAVSVGGALAAAKRTYISTTADIRGIHEKAVLEATLFGLPMFGVNMPAGRGAAPGGGNGPIDPAPVIDGTDRDDLGLATHDLSVDTPTTPRSLPLDVVGPTGVTGSVTASWLEGPDGVVTNPAEPAIPKEIVDVTPTNGDYVLRGVGFRGGTYTDTANILPLTGAPTTELRGVHAPFVSPVFYPMRMWTPNYFGELGGTGGTNLIVTPVQHRTDPANTQRSIRRAFDDLDLRLFYVDAPTLLDGPLKDAALADAPTIVDVRATPAGADLLFSARVIGDPKATVHEVWVVYTAGSGVWQPLDLQQCTGTTLPASCAGLEDSRLWTGRLAGAPASVEYVVQAANGTGLVSFDDNRGQYYRGSTTPAPAPAETTLTLVSPPPSGTFGQTVSVSADLKAGSTALVGRPVVIQIGGSAAFGVTGATGRVTVPIALNSTPGPTTITASFGGDATHLTSSATSSFTIGKAVSTLSSINGFVTTDGEQRGIVTSLRATLGAQSQPLQNRTVTVTVTGPVTRTLSIITDYLGQVRLPLGLPAGTYTVTATFAGDETYVAASRSGSTTLVGFTFTTPVDKAPIVNVAKAGSTIPVKFSIGGNYGLGILASTPQIVRYSCETGVPQDEIEQTVTANSGLVFANGLYQYNWKTAKNTTGCFRFELRLTDGSVHVALFRLR